MQAETFSRPDGSKFTVHEGEDFKGDTGFYWCEPLVLGHAQNYSEQKYLSGRSGVGPFATFEAARLDAQGHGG